MASAEVSEPLGDHARHRRRAPAGTHNPATTTGADLAELVADPCAKTAMRVQPLISIAVIAPVITPAVNVFA